MQHRLSHKKWDVYLQIMSAPNKYCAGRAYAERGGSSLSDQAPTLIVEKSEALRLFEVVTEFTSVEGHAVKLESWSTKIGDSIFAKDHVGVPTDILIPTLFVLINNELVEEEDVIEHPIKGACISSYGIPVAQIPAEHALAVVQEMKRYQRDWTLAWDEVRHHEKRSSERRSRAERRAETRALELTALKLEQAQHEGWRRFRVGLLWFLAICLGIAANRYASF
jgi:hypothetical protein